MFVATPTTVYIQVDDPREFAKIDRPSHDHAPKALLTKTVEQDGVLVVFQHWITAELGFRRDTKNRLEVVFIRPDFWSTPIWGSEQDAGSPTQRATRPDDQPTGPAAPVQCAQSRLDPASAQAHATPQKTEAHQ